VNFRVYIHTPSEHIVTNVVSGRKMRIQKYNFPDTVIWNPWDQRAKVFLYLSWFLYDKGIICHCSYMAKVYIFICHGSYMGKCISLFGMVPTYMAKVLFVMVPIWQRYYLSWLLYDKGIYLYLSWLLYRHWQSLFVLVPIWLRYYFVMVPKWQRYYLLWFLHGKGIICRF
jgi:hypothetical protein